MASRAARWRVVRDGARRGPWNMAVDRALLESAGNGGCTLRLYAWSPACLSFGRNQRASGLFDPRAIAARGFDVVRRPTGGLAVLHDAELTYSVTGPVRRLGRPRAAYRAVNAALVEALRSLGVPAGLAPAGPSPHPGRDAASPCFDAPAPGEVVARQRKLVGSAQRTERGAILQHGSILLSGRQSQVADLRAADAERPSMPSALPSMPAARPSAGVAAASAGSITLTELLPTAPTPDDVAAAVIAAFVRVFDAAMEPDPLGTDEVARALELEARFSDRAWTWRR